MNLLFIVIDDLYQFALTSITRFFVVAQDTTSLQEYIAIETQNEADIPVPHEDTYMEPVITVTPSESLSEETVSPLTFRQAGDIIAEKRQEGVLHAKHSVMYAGAVSVAIFEHPTRTFDTVIGNMNYGDMAVVLEEKGKYVRIASGALEGWVLREDLVDRAAYVYPEFTIGEENDVDDPNTIRVRAMLDDEFGGALVEYPLQAGEYVAYKLLRKGLRIAWPKTRPRTPGLWHVILKGVPGIHIGITPKTGAVMEYMLPGEIGHVAYVETVFPDETITLSEANFPHGGIYNERVITREEWREFRPVFIQMS